MNPTEITQCKVIITGAGGTGKTALVSRLLASSFEPRYIETSGVEIHQLLFRTAHNLIQFNVWDCAGQEHLCGLRYGYYINADAAIVFLDDGGEWRQFVRAVKHVDAKIPIFYVRSKFDISNQKVLRTPENFINISAKTDFNCKKPFEEIAQHFGHGRFVSGVLKIPEEPVDADSIRRYEQELALAARPKPLDDE